MTEVELTPALLAALKTDCERRLAQPYAAYKRFEMDSAVALALVVEVLRLRQLRERCPECDSASVHVRHEVPFWSRTTQCQNKWHGSHGQRLP